MYVFTLQASPMVQSAIAPLDGIDALLLAVSPFKRKDPANAEEAELVENLLGALCSALLLSDNQTLFLKAEGVELMLLALREGRFSARGALKALNFALQRNAVVCER
ncbi:hypothetical protein T492DRAFT_440177 [Pavlovales sp. CCMP2436]|nr:hypothetical protein T492DRAFT_440177 [Pavlovales sp. CCMP2436]